MDLGLLALRIAHIVAGASWVGGAFLMILVIAKTAKAKGKAGEEFLDAALVANRGARYFELIALTTVLAGAALYWRASDGLQVAWITSPTGIGFTVGALAAIVSLVWGGSMVGPTSAKLSRMGQEIVAAGGVPTAEQAATIARLQGRLDAFAKADLGLLSVAVIAMATARYL